MQCTGDDNYYCGGRETPEEGTVYLSVYEYQPINPGIVIDSILLQDNNTLDHMFSYSIY